MVGKHHLVSVPSSSSSQALTGASDLENEQCRAIADTPPNAVGCSRWAMRAAGGGPGVGRVFPGGVSANP